MITKWTVSNFKSVVKETSLDLAPLTILAGPNSSGKSTVLQGLLLVSQTLASKVSSRSVVLNGTLTRLGQFDDLRSNDGEFDQITLGWELRPTEDTVFSLAPYLPASALFSGRRPGNIREIACKLSFDADPGSADRELYQLQPQLFLFSMSVLVRDFDNIDRRSELTVTRNPDGGAKIVSHGLIQPESAIDRASLDYDISLDRHSLEDSWGELGTARPVGCVLQHFLPDRVAVAMNTVEERAAQIYTLLMENALTFYCPSLFEQANLVPQAVLLLVRDRYIRMGIDPPALFAAARDMHTEDFMNQYEDDLRPDEKGALRRMLAEWPDLQKELARIVRSECELGQPEWELSLQDRLPTNLRAASGYLSGYFSGSVKYLGPLRDEPKPLYPLAAHADPVDVGLRGEMTAAVLNLHRDRFIRYVPSAAFTQTPFVPRPVPRSFEAAVTDWLRYLGVADTVHSVDRGKLGHELKVSLSERGPEQDLTHVGVGVSQVLPILVMALLADQDTTLIFEQPELHLHPMVQTRLGDFFLSIALSGRQCLIETHSEYLINRLRYRAAAEGDGNRVTDSLKVYFVEKKDGASNFREVKVNEYGAILDWPEGFFDQSQFESESILRAAAAKRRLRGRN